MSGKCTCPSPKTDWAPERPCGGIIVIAGGEPEKDPPWCEVHMKPWGHRRGCPVHDLSRGDDRG